MMDFDLALYVSAGRKQDDDSVCVCMDITLFVVWYCS